MLDLKNKRFGRLIAIEIHKRGGTDKVNIWKCKCDCGNTTYVRSTDLRHRKTRSCGCLSRDLIKQRSYKHGDAKRGHTKKLYWIWGAIRNRCYNSNFSQYKNYGGKGIQVCDSWRNNYSEFKTWALNNGYKSGLVIDRINNNGDYIPKNCQWLTRQENTRKSNLENPRKNNLKRNDKGQFISKSEDSINYEYVGDIPKKIKKKERL